MFWIFSPYRAKIIFVRIEFFDDEIERILTVDHVTGEIISKISYIAIYPAMHYVAEPEQMERAYTEILDEMEKRVEFFKERGKLIEAQRIRERTMYDIEFLKQLGYCKGIENYSRILTGRPPGSTRILFLIISRKIIF